MDYYYLFKNIHKRGKFRICQNLENDLSHFVNAVLLKIERGVKNQIPNMQTYNYQLIVNETLAPPLKHPLSDTFLRGLKIVSVKFWVVLLFFVFGPLSLSYLT